jgi:hypothetical protein
MWQSVSPLAMSINPINPLYHFEPVKCSHVFSLTRPTELCQKKTKDFASVLGPDFVPRLTRVFDFSDPRESWLAAIPFPKLAKRPQPKNPVRTALLLRARYETQIKPLLERYHTAGSVANEYVPRHSARNVRLSDSK